jgi:molecular chaperone Hsp33
MPIRSILSSAFNLRCPHPAFDKWRQSRTLRSMPETQTPTTEESGAIITTEFIRHRNALLVRGTFTDLFVDYYLHLADNGIRLPPGHDRILKEGIVAVALHAASRPQQEIVAWTVNFQDPLLNVFLSGDNEDFTVVGRVFADNVRVAPQQLIYADVVRKRGQPRRSAVDFQGSSPFSAAEALYRQSEQRIGRFFDLGSDRFALLAQHPDCDELWFESVDAAALSSIDDRETVVRIERRRYTWNCGCSEDKLMRVLSPQMRADPDELFAGEELIHVQCPRCAARYTITREAMEAWVAANGPK